MGVTWQDIKLATLKKLDPSVTSLNMSRNTKDYLNAIVPVANRGLQDLATAGKFIVKDVNIVIPEVQNLLTGSESLQQHINESIPFYAKNAKAYYFEITGKGTVNIKVGEDTVKTIINEAENGFTSYKGKIENDDNENVTIEFAGSYPYLFRNVALYDVEFETDDDVWEYSLKKRFDLKELVNDFFKLVSQDVVYESNDMPYIKYEEYEWEGDSTLILNGIKKGTYKVHYYAYPQTITEDTPDDFVLSLDPEVANILPLYMAAELYEDDDLNTAYYFRQQYQEAKVNLIPTALLGKAQFVDKWGW